MSRNQLANLYKTDFHEWTREQARRIRAGEPIDAKHVAEEIEDMGKRHWLAVQSHIINIIEHLLKLDLPSSENVTWTVENENGWKRSIRNARAQIALHLESSPSLVRMLNDAGLTQCYRYAKDRVSGEYEVELNPECPYTWDEILPPEYRKPPRKGARKSTRRHKPPS